MSNLGIFENQSWKSGRKIASVVPYIKGFSVPNLDDIRDLKVKIRKGEHPLGACCLFKVCGYDRPVHMIFLRQKNPDWE